METKPTWQARDKFYKNRYKNKPVPISEAEETSGLGSITAAIIVVAVVTLTVSFIFW